MQQTHTCMNKQARETSAPSHMSFVQVNVGVAWTPRVNPAARESQTNTREAEIAEQKLVNLQHRNLVRTNQWERNYSVEEAGDQKADTMHFIIDYQEEDDGPASQPLPDVNRHFGSLGTSDFSQGLASLYSGAMSGLSKERTKERDQAESKAGRNFGDEPRGTKTDPFVLRDFFPWLGGNSRYGSSNDFGDDEKREHGARNSRDGGLNGFGDVAPQEGFEYIM